MNRPFYKRKRILIPAIIVFVLLAASIMGKSKRAGVRLEKAEAGIGDTAVMSSTENGNGGLDLKTRIENNIKSISGDDDLTKDPLNNATAFMITAAIFKAYAAVVKEGETSKDKQVLLLTSQLQKKVIASQVKNLPKIRLEYYEFLREKLWENDVYVDVSGKDHTILKFTGDFFASNKNIKQTEDALSEMLSLLRFKQTQYRWYKDQSEYTYYNIDSAKDSELVE